MYVRYLTRQEADYLPSSGFTFMSNYGHDGYSYELKSSECQWLVPGTQED